MEIIETLLFDWVYDDHRDMWNAYYPTTSEEGKPILSVAASVWSDQTRAMAEYRYLELYYAITLGLTKNSPPLEDRDGYL